MKITILDKETIGTDIKVEELEKYGIVEIYNTTTVQEVHQRISDANIIITNKVIIGKSEFEKAKELKLICVAATGYNNIDILEANNRGVVVANARNYSTESVAQHVFSYILSVSNSIFEYQHFIKQNQWQKSDIFTSLSHPITELRGKTLGIIGYGNIGKRVAEIGRVFGMNVIISKRKHDISEQSGRTNFAEVIQKSDYLTVHCPLNEETRNLISQKEFQEMKSNAVIINTARGGIINEEDLYNALYTNTIRGAIVDVLSEEPPHKGNILFNAPNIIITPHIAWTSVEARNNLFKKIKENIENYLSGNINKLKL